MLFARDRQVAERFPPSEMDKALRNEVLEGARAIGIEDAR